MGETPPTQQRPQAGDLAPIPAVPALLNTDVENEGAVVGAGADEADVHAGSSLNCGDRPRR